MTVLVAVVLHNIYSWFDCMNGNDLSEIVAGLACGFGIVLGLVIDIRACWYEWLK